MEEEKKEIVDQINEEPEEQLSDLFSSDQSGEESNKEPAAKEHNFFETEKPAHHPKLSYATHKKSKLTTIGLLVAVLVILGVGGVFGWKYFKNKVVAPTNPVASAVPVAATPTPTPTLNPSEWSFEVLNGSGVTGEAKKAAAKLTEKGFMVVKTGNADKDTYKTNLLYVRAEKGDQTNLLVTALQSDFNIASVSGVLTEGTASARLILGKE